MFEFINDQQLKEIASAILNNEDYSFNENGLNIQAKSSENGYSIQMSYSEPKEDLVKKEKEDFEKWLEELDDDLFTGVCDFMGQDEISNISNCLSSDDLETFRAGILKFKMYYKKYIDYRIEYYNRCLANLPK